MVICIMLHMDLGQLKWVFWLAERETYQRRIRTFKGNNQTHNLHSKPIVHASHKHLTYCGTFYHMVFGSCFKYLVFKTLILYILQFFRVLKTWFGPKFFSRRTREQRLAAFFSRHLTSLMLSLLLFSIPGLSPLHDLLRPPSPCSLFFSHIARANNTFSWCCRLWTLSLLLTRRAHVMIFFCRFGTSSWFCFEWDHGS
jgi:hypothetical protein